MTISARLCLHAARVTFVLDASAGQPPAVLHWGAALGDLSESEAAAQTPPIVPNGPNAPVRVALVPEGRTGWQGRPGLTGSRNGRDWTPHWVLSAVTVDGVPAPEHANLGPCLVVFEAVDANARLGLTIEVELLASGRVRARAAMSNTGDEDDRVDEMLVAFPVPMRAREILDFASRWTKERVPQRTTLQVGMHWREARHGRTGADSAFSCIWGHPGSASPTASCGRSTRRGRATTSTTPSGSRLVIRWSARESCHCEAAQFDLRRAARSLAAERSLVPGHPAGCSCTA